MPQILELENKEVLFVISKKFNERELYLPMRFLENKGCGVSICSESLEPVENKIYVLPDFTYKDVDPEKFDGVIFVGGKEVLDKKEELKDLALNFNSKGKLIGAIGNSKAILVTAGLIKPQKKEENIITCESSNVDSFGNKIAEKLTNSFNQIITDFK